MQFLLVVEGFLCPEDEVAAAVAFEPVVEEDVGFEEELPDVPDLEDVPVFGLDVVPFIN